MRPTRILVECTDLTASVRVGVLEPLKSLIEARKCEVKFKRTWDINKNDIEWCDTLICVRGCEALTLEIVDMAKKANRKVIYFLDDDLLNIPKDLPSSSYYSKDKIRNNLVTILEQSDICWCVNNRILEKYKKYTNARWFIGRVPVELLENRENNKGETINILYAGSRDNTNNVRKFITPAVNKLNYEFKNLTFTFIGVNPGLKESKKVKIKKHFYNYDKYKEYVKKGNFDIGLAPIGMDEFYCCKYYNKFIEYTSIGAVGIYTRNMPYTQIINNEINGLLCDNTVEDWYMAMKKLIVDKELRMKCLNNSKLNILLDFNHEKVSMDLENGIPELTSYYANI